MFVCFVGFWGGLEGRDLSCFCRSAPNTRATPPQNQSGSRTGSDAPPFLFASRARPRARTISTLQSAPRYLVTICEISCGPSLVTRMPFTSDTATAPGFVRPIIRLHVARTNWCGTQKTSTSASAVADSRSGSGEREGSEGLGLVLWGCVLEERVRGGVGLVGGRESKSKRESAGRNESDRQKATTKKTHPRSRWAPGPRPAGTRGSRASR